ncbi:MAG: glycosyltransferase family 4 protein [Candidatus Competibacteraceae bacterium]|nr:glycosyltransferase family 4 protein [Candidatus Competibacteraceae bacterium]
MAIMAGFLTFVVAFVLARYAARSVCWLRILDHPNDRSLHYRPTPRTGGLAVLGAGLTGMVLSSLAISDARSGFGILLPGLIPLVVVSFLDDRHSVSIMWRLLAHVWASASLAIAGYAPNSLELTIFAFPVPAWLSVSLTLLFTAWMINLYNFMDGMDGFAGGMAVIGFTTLAWLGRTDSSFANYCLIVAAASAGFLIHNFPPAKIFMGDTGSTALGFLVAACSLWGSKSGLFPFWVAILVFSPFIVDATATLLRRLLRGERVWEAHRTHYYQRLVLLGWGHRRTVLAEYGLMLACAGSAVVAVHLPPAGQWILIVGWIVIYSFLMWGVGRLERRHATVSAP